MTPERISRLHEVLQRRQPDLTVITDFVHKQRNLSALVRISDAVGIMQLHAVIGDEDYQAFRGTAMGAHNWVEVEHYATLPEAITPLRQQGMQIVAAHPVTTAVDYHTLDYTKPTALLLGAERRGVSAEAAAAADYCVKIPMVGMVHSLNVSVAAGVILAEAQRQRDAAGLYAQCRIDAATYERLFFEWGHPSVRDYCNERGLHYPPLNDAGEIDNPAAWYAAVRRGDAPRREN
ncbi:MAG: tRNA (guanosine(18)-2'-O)-methyltransferase TrmH [Halioglobus sp.]